jgi:hypothetical protein
VAEHDDDLVESRRSRKIDRMLQGRFAPQLQELLWASEA